MFSTMTSIVSITTKPSGGGVSFPALAYPGVASYTFNSPSEISGSTIVNRSSKTFDMTMNDSSSIVSGISGCEGTSCFQSTNDNPVTKYAMSSTSLFTTDNTNATLSISFWIKSLTTTAPSTNREYIFTLCQSNVANYYMSFYIDYQGFKITMFGNSNPTTSVPIPSGGGAYVTKSGGFYTQQWNHFVITSQKKTAPSFKVYLNGVDQNYAPTYNGYFGGITIDKLVIGGFKDGSYGFNGYIDCVRLFSTVLSASDVTTLYNSGVPY